MAHQLQLEKAKYRQWAKAGLGLGYLKEGLAPFCQDIAKQQHKDILDNIQLAKSLPLPVTCGTCQIKTLKPDHVKAGNKVCPYGQTYCNCWFPDGKIPCPNNICGAIYDGIIQSHASRPPAPNWKNTDAQMWTADPWSIAKCFINASGYDQKTSAADTDCTGLLHVIINNNYFYNHIACNLTGTSIFSKVLQYRNEIFHSSSMELEETEANSYIDDMISILQDGKELKNNTYAQENVKKLQVLKTKDLIITTRSMEEILCQIKEEMEKILNLTENQTTRDEIEDLKPKVDAKDLIEKEYLIAKENLELTSNEKGEILEAEREHAEQKKKLTEPEGLTYRENESTVECENVHAHLERLPELETLKSEEIEQELEVEKENAELKLKLRELETLIKNYRNTMKQVYMALLEEEQKGLFMQKVEVIEEDNFQQKQQDDEQVNSVSWTESIGYARQLVKTKTLPSQSEVNEACHVFGRHSTVLSDMCDLICEHINKKSQDITCVWPAYETDSSILSVVFVVVMQKESYMLEFKDYDCKFLFENLCNDEGNLVASKTLKHKASCKQEYTDKLKQMRACINKNAEDLFNRHSNLNVILPSLKKSTGYSSGNHDISVAPCIALYVHLKGYIPLMEEPFKEEIGGFQIDVLEGEFTPFMEGANDGHLKIGSAIYGKDSIVGPGTLGGFVDHSLHGLCTITCAHVVYSKDELTQIKENKKSILKEVYHPTGEDSSVGESVIAVYDEGNESVPGVDVALIKIWNMLPKDGSFPTDIGDGSDENKLLCFNSGEVCETANIDLWTVVYKIGMKSGFTRGTFEMQGGTAMRKEIADGTFKGFRFFIRDQIVILSSGNQPFAKQGDSGALVLMKGKEGSVAIGIVEGAINPSLILVTPICDILRAVGCKKMQMHEFKSDSKIAYNTVSPMWSDSQRMKKIITFAGVMVLIMCIIIFL